MKNIKRYTKVNDDLYVNNEQNTGDYVKRNNPLSFINIYQDFKVYKRLSSHIVKNQVNQHFDPSLRGFDKFHIDHKIPLYIGFKYKISIEDINHISNLQFVSKEFNLKKGTKIQIDNSNKWMLIKYNLDLSNKYKHV